MDVGLVCDACSALTPIGVPQCARCGQPVALDPRPKRGSKPAPIKSNAAPDGEATTCNKCGTHVPPNFCTTTFISRVSQDAVSPWAVPTLLL